MGANDILHTIRSRRVIRKFTDTPVAREDLLRVLEAGRWAPAGGNRRLHRFIAIQDPVTVRLVRAVSPGMGNPSALVVICIDWETVQRLGVKPHHRTVYIDVGTTAENMLLAAHGLGLGAGPVTSFSKEAVRVLLGLPPSWTPEMIVCLGHAVPRDASHQHRPHTPTRLEDLVHWERYGGRPGPGA